MRLEPGDRIVSIEENCTLRGGIFANFTDASEKKAIIFPQYRTVATEKIIRVTIPQLEVLIEKIRNYSKDWRKTKNEELSEE